MPDEIGSAEPQKLSPTPDHHRALAMENPVGNALKQLSEEVGGESLDAPSPLSQRLSTPGPDRLAVVPEEEIEAESDDSPGIGRSGMEIRREAEGRPPGRPVSLLDSADDDDDDETLAGGGASGPPRPPAPPLPSGSGEPPQLPEDARRWARRRRREQRASWLREERREQGEIPRTPSRFQIVMANIRVLEQGGITDETHPQLAPLIAERNRLINRANELELNLEGERLLSQTKDELFTIYYNSRVGVTRAEKLGKGDWSGRGKLQELLNIQRAMEIAYGLGNGGGMDPMRALQLLDSYGENRTLLGEDRVGIWSGREALRQELGGVVDYFALESIKAIRAVVKNRNTNEGSRRDDIPPNTGISGAWDYDWRPDYNEEGESPIHLRGFDDVRDQIELERRKRYFTPSRGNYETWIEFVADDVKEVEDSIPYILAFIKGKFVQDDPNSNFNTVEEEKKKIQKAVEQFGFNFFGADQRHPKYRAFRRLKSRLIHEVSLLGANEFSNIVHEDWEPYLKFAANLARGFGDTESSDSWLDAVYLAQDGLMPLALHLYEQNDGEFWRYGVNTATTPTDYQINRGLAWQDGRRMEFLSTLVNSKLRDVRDLLNLTAEGIPQPGKPNHPAFLRIKKKLDDLDIEDKRRITAGAGVVQARLGEHDELVGLSLQQGDASALQRKDKIMVILDELGNPVSRWQEYCRKAWDWQNGRYIGDPRDYMQRVLFQHPLARGFRKVGYVELDSQGNVASTTTEDEFEAMFEQIPPPRTERERRAHAARGRKAIAVRDTAERIARAFQEDAAAGLSRHTLSFVQLKELGFIPGDVELDGKGNPVLDHEGNPVNGSFPCSVWVEVKNPDTGDLERKLVPEAIPHNVLLRHLLQQSMEYDKKKGRPTEAGETAQQRAERMKRMRYKITYALQNAVGLDRSMPVFSNWYLGAHDTIRPGWLPLIKQIDGFKQMLEEREAVRRFESDDEFGGDAKVVLTRWVEDEREVQTAMEIVIRQLYGSYFNFPGHVTPGGGNKEARNLFLLVYGQSRGTVELNSFIPAAILGETTFLQAFGCSSWEEFTGLFKGADEVMFQEIGSLFVAPRDAENWVKRVREIIGQQKILFSGEGKGGSYGMANTGGSAGNFHARALNRTASYENAPDPRMGQRHFRGRKDKIPVNQWTAMNYPEIAYANLDEATYERYIETAGKVIGPLMTLLESRLKLENVYGRSPGTAKFLNTLTWYTFSNWMDNNWIEFRGKMGNAVDVNLHVFRRFIHTVLYESRLIFSDTEWDQRMLGYTIPKAEWELVQKDQKDLTEGEKIKLKEMRQRGLTKKIRYGKSPNGNALEYQEDPKKIDGTLVFGREVEGYTVEGILDAFPPDLRNKIINDNNDLKLLPFGLDSDFPENLGIIQEMAARGEHRGMRKLYEQLLKPQSVAERQIKRRKNTLWPTEP
ncbi:MAG TPA: hypothetical protein VJG66_04740 [Patescibacteria group bacterium]|nr:hypothetical protein [Patescibacteria group bacterium]